MDTPISPSATLMSSTQSPPAHALFIPAPPLSHWRQLIGLASRIIRERPGRITITIPVAGDTKLFHKELSRYFPSEEDQALKDDVHIISLGGLGIPMPTLLQVYMENFAAFYTSLETLAPVKCATGPIHTFKSPPAVILADVFLYDAVQIIRQTSRRKVLVLCWSPGLLAPIMRILGPEELGGLGDVKAKAKVLAEKTGRPAVEFELELSYPEAGDVVQSPGIPPMYDYEYYPQEAEWSFRQFRVTLHMKAYSMITDCDGSISATSAAFEPEATQATRAWYARDDKPFYCIGPLLFDDVVGERPSDVSKVAGDNATDQQVLTFLDKIYATFGEHSLIYVCFGTFFWPKTNGIWKVLEDIIDSNRPLLVGYDAERLGNMPEDTAAKFKASDIAMIANWLPQQSILNNRATGWFMMQGGNNSLMEAIVQGVPMIVLPMDSDQPGNAAYMSVKLDIAYEVIEARSGPGLKPMYRGLQPKGTEEAFREEMRNILNDAFGEGGKRKRENIRAYQEKVKASLREGGESHRDFVKFVEDFLSA